MSLTTSGIRNERLESLVDMSRASWMPTARGGKPVSAQALKRWAIDGCRGVKLEVVRVGTLLCSSRQAFERFIAELSKIDAVEFKNGGAGSAQRREPVPA